MDVTAHKAHSADLILGLVVAGTAAREQGRFRLTRWARASHRPPTPRVGAASGFWSATLCLRGVGGFVTTLRRLREAAGSPRVPCTLPRG